MPTTTGPIFVQRFGFNRATPIFYIGENLELHALISCEGGFKWKLTRYRKTAAVTPDAHSQESVAGGVLLKLQFDNATQSDEGDYELTVYNSAGASSQVYGLLSRATCPVIASATPQIYDIRKPISVKAKVSGAVELYQWMVRRGSDENDYVDIEEQTQADVNKPAITIPASIPKDWLNGGVVELQACAYAWQMGSGFFDETELNDYAALGVVAIPSQSVKVKTKPPVGVVAGASPTISMAVHSKTPWLEGMKYQVFCFINGSEDVVPVELEIPNQPWPPGASWPPNTMHPLTIEYPHGDIAPRPQLALDPTRVSKYDFIAYFPWSGEAVYLGSTQVYLRPVIENIQPASTAENPLVVRKGVEVTLTAPSVHGTPPLKFAWFYSTDSRRSWKQISTSAVCKFKPTASGIAVLGVTNKYGTDYSEGASEIYISVQNLALGQTKKPGLK